MVELTPRHYRHRECVPDAVSGIGVRLDAAHRGRLATGGGGLVVDAKSGRWGTFGGGSRHVTDLSRHIIQ